jgi:hypothetical protein
MLGGDPNINDKSLMHGIENLFRGFVRENPGAKKKSTIPQRKDANRAKKNE